MCGRFVVARATGELVSTFKVKQKVGEDLPPSYNVAPTDNVRIVIEHKPHAGGDVARELVSARWGLVPSWSKDPKAGARLINARVETVTEKPSFRKAAATRRALVGADGYYEWQQGPTGKIPTYLHGVADNMLAFAALYEYWLDPSLDDDDPQKWLRTFTIITTAASDALGHIHDRTPVIVTPDLYSDWLDPSITHLADVRDLLGAMPEPHLVPRRVSTEVNSVRNNGPQLISEIA
jgi:putative SOS response-associated peptidase YedK